MSQKGFIMELLAPAGTMENFMAALESGADAIYLGGKVFNARAHAANFGIDELREAVRLAHILDVSVYVTVNILIGDTELKDLEQYIKDLDSIGVDAIIVQDLAVAEIAKRVAPNIHLHGSTQMTAATLDAVRFYESLGFTRVVLARELSLKEIQHICKHCKAEIEVFVHGALCVCYSGQCLMSSFIGGRSGNRGACAQPCRLPYELLDSKGESVLPKHEAYLLSPKDLNYSEHMNELVAAGVTSFKVEGRMKKVSYVRQVIGTYREILDEASIHENQRKALASGFNRGFSTAYLEDTVGRQMMTVVAPNHQGKPIGESYTKKGEVYLSLTEPIEQGSLVKILQSNGSVTYYTVDDEWTCVSDTLYKGRPAEGLAVGQLYLASTPKNTKSRGLQEFTRKYDMSVYLSVGSNGETNYTELTAILDSGLSVTVTNEYVPAIANKVPTSLEKVTEQLGRLGNTLFRLSYVDIPDGPYMWPASVLNALRRDAVTALETALITHHVESWQALQVTGDIDYDFKAQHELSYDTCPMISARVDEIEGVKAAISGGAQKIVFGGDRLSRTPYALSVYDEVARLCAQSDVICTFATPRVVKDDEVEAYKHTLEAIVQSHPDSISIHVPQALLWLRELGYTGAIEADTGLNIFNTPTLHFWEQLHISCVNPSQELTLKQITELAKHSHVPIETMIHGYTEMMISEYCAIASFVGTGSKVNCPMPCVKESYSLKDRKGEIFPIRTDPYCRMHIMNSHEMDMRAYVPMLLQKGISILRVDGRHMKPSYVKDIVSQYVGIATGTMEAPPKKIDSQGESITRGHYFRGIL
ncbi:peptidase, U32 family [Veillonella atypica ACS-134-V-Col7a]|uniref:Peptidase, U32 family n=1 Tax=Veillonella atypica ACS-134-V-Col7a TaxID=866778 RepID=E1L990_9FIRM|nr:U32 family peptidase [Veillonella atypica]EFL58866.1 peptidase, U32 family [Veillonella atypica ACS-134-V-Col7a]